MRVLAAITAAVIAGAGCSEKGENLPPGLPPPFARTPIAAFTLVSSNERAGAKILTFTNAAWTAKIDVIDGVEQLDADALTHDGIMGIEALYAQALSPYPGDISREVSGDKHFSPRPLTFEVDGRERRAFVLFANDRFGYGATTSDAASYRSLVTWIYCPPRKELYKVRLFAPRDTADADLIGCFTGVRCRLAAP